MCFFSVLLSYIVFLDEIVNLQYYFSEFNWLLRCTFTYIYYLFNASIEFKEIGISFFAIFLEVQNFSGK